MKRSFILSALFVSLLLSGCSSKQPAVVVEKYQPAFRSSPPDTIYSRVMWSHLPHPIKPKALDTAPFVLPEVEFDMPNATFGEAIEALAQSMGYRWLYPSYLATRHIELSMEGTVEEVLREIGLQADVVAKFDHKNRLVRVLEKKVVPTLP